MGGILLLATALAVVVLVVWALIAAFTKRRVLRPLKYLLAVLVGYSVVLLGVSAVSASKELGIGDDKCFDDWCATVVSYEREKGGIRIELQTVNKARFAERPDTPQLFLVVDGAWKRVDAPFLNDRMRARTVTNHTIHLKLPDDFKQASLVLTEGGFPTRLTIGDENSPLHGKSLWPLVLAGK